MEEGCVAGTSCPYLFQHKDQIISKKSAITVWDLRQPIVQDRLGGANVCSPRVTWSNEKIRERKIN